MLIRSTGSADRRSLVNAERACTAVRGLRQLLRDRGGFGGLTDVTGLADKKLREGQRGAGVPEALLRE